MTTRLLTRGLTRTLTQQVAYDVLAYWELLANANTTTGRGLVATNTRSTIAHLLDTDGILRQASALNPAFPGARYISADVWSKYDISGVLLSTLRGIVCAPQRTNLVPYSEDATQWTEQGTCTVSSSGTIAGRAAFQLTGQTAIWHRRVFLISPLTGKHSVSIYIAPGNQNIGRVEIQDTDAAVITRIDCNSSDGSTVSVATDAGTFTSESEAVNGGYRFIINFTPLTDGNIFWVGVGTGTAIPTDTIRVTAAQVESGNAASGYIVTIGSSLTRTADTSTLPIENYNDEMTVTFDWTPHFDYDDLPVSTFSKGIITPTATPSEGVSYGRESDGSGFIKVYDEVNTASTALENYTKDTTYKICASWSKSRGLMGIAVAGTDSGDGTFAGFTLASVITLGMGSIEEFTIKNLEFRRGFSSAAERITLTS